MKIFPVFDSILLPLAPSIAGTIAGYLQVMTQFGHNHHPNCDDRTQLSPDATCQWQVTKSMKLIPTSQYQYVSPIAHRLAAKSSLTPLEICQKLQSPTLSPKIDRATSLELSCWYNDAGYIYVQVTPLAIALWLTYIQNLPLAIDRVEARSPSATIAVYAHARCCAVLTLAATAQIIQLGADWQIISPPPTSEPHGRYLVTLGITEWTSSLDAPAERQLIRALMAVLDILASHDLPAHSPRKLAWREGEIIESGRVGISTSADEIRSPNWHKLTLDLAQSWLEFYRHCRIFGDVHSQNPRLAIARCGLTAIVRRYLQVLLENHLGIGAAIDL